MSRQHCTNLPNIKQKDKIVRNIALLILGFLSSAIIGLFIG